MANLFDYLFWRGDLTLAQSGFNEVDGAILARAAYFPFDAAGLNGRSRLSMGAAAGTMLLVPEIKKRLVLEDMPLMEALGESARFRGMTLFGFENIFEAEKETQFSAVTVQLDENLYYISFRGTDNTLVGWKENFNMAFESPVPAQALAAEYVNKTAVQVSGRLILGGHSKGGNLAVYAGAFCGGDAQARVEAVYNFDGPGFDGRVLSQPGYDRICGRIHTLVPQSSVVGMLLEHEEEYAIVHSTQTGLLQHDLYSWEVERTGFKRLEAVTDGSRFIDAAVKTWIAEMDYGRREAFVDAVYEILSETNAKTLREMGQNWPASAMAVLRSAHELDEPTKKLLRATLQSLAESAGAELFRAVQNRADG